MATTGDIMTKSRGRKSQEEPCDLDKRVSFPGGIPYAWALERKWGLPKNTIFDLPGCTQRFLNLMEEELERIADEADKRCGLS